MIPLLKEKVVSVEYQKVHLSSFFLVSSFLAFLNKSTATVYLQIATLRFSPFCCSCELARSLLGKNIL